MSLTLNKKIMVTLKEIKFVLEKNLEIASNSPLRRETHMAVEQVLNQCYVDISKLFPSVEEVKEEKEEKGNE